MFGLTVLLIRRFFAGPDEIAFTSVSVWSRLKSRRDGTIARPIVPSLRDLAIWST
jgi:hypothetical protein